MIIIRLKLCSNVHVYVHNGMYRYDRPVKLINDAPLYTVVIIIDKKWNLLQLSQSRVSKHNSHAMRANTGRPPNCLQRWPNIKCLEKYCDCWHSSCGPSTYVIPPCSTACAAWWTPTWVRSAAMWILWFSEAKRHNCFKFGQI